jgi:type III restriction enzyme
MTIVPKQYQRRALEAWASFLDRVAGGASAGDAFAHTTTQVWGRPLPYVPPPCLGAAPSVCLRIPTGGGKTLIAAGACGIAAASGCLLGAEARTVVVWLVPSTAIGEQTLLALRDPKHACHRALVDGLGGHPGVGPVQVLDIDEALALPVATVRSGAVVVVATIQSFKASDKEQRQVYRQNGQLMDHGLVDPDLVHVLARYRPLVVVDEAHNARTDATFDVLGELNPSLVLEITATPVRGNDARLPSNVLISASANELHAEHMLKLPLVLDVNADPDLCLGKAVRRRGDLQRLAELEVAAGAPFLRPLLLVQAQAKKAGTETLTPEVVKQKLIEDHGVPAAAIRIATGSVRELDDIDHEFPRGLQDPLCPVTTIITVEALREGWDCPAAYVLCTLKGSFTETSAVQIVGRVLRQPGATPRPTADLNRAYVVAAMPSFAQALGQLRDVLVDSLGYERETATSFAVAAPTNQDVLTLALPEPVRTPSGTPLIASRIAALPTSLQAKLQVDTTTGVLAVNSWLDEPERQQVTACIEDAPTAVAFNHALRSAFDRSAEAQNTNDVLAAACPADRGVPFVVPVILVESQQRWQVVNDTVLDDSEWTLSEESALLDEQAYSPSAPRFARAEVDVDRTGHVVSRLREGEDVITAPSSETPEGRLIWWLTERLPTTDIHPDDLSRWLAQALTHLTRTRGVELARLEADQWNLKRALSERLDAERLNARRASVQKLLFDAGTRERLRPSPRERSFRFDPTSYPASDFERNVRFKRHYYRAVGAFDSDEERECAMQLDDLPEVLTWVRNLVRREPFSFRLPRRPGPTGRWFYPDFVALLRDGRTLVAEYKGAALSDAQDTVDKRESGELWERTTGGLFVLVVDRDFEAIKRKLASTPLPRGVHPSWPPGLWERIEREGPTYDLGDIPPMGFPLNDTNPADLDGRP